MQSSQHRIVGTLKQLCEENVKPSFSANPRPQSPHQNTVNKLRQPIAARTPRVTPNKPPAKPTEIDMIKFDPSNPLDSLEDLEDLSSVGHLGIHIDNFKDVAVDNVNTDKTQWTSRVQQRNLSVTSRILQQGNCKCQWFDPKPCGHCLTFCNQHHHLNF